MKVIRGDSDYNYPATVSANTTFTGLVPPDYLLERIIIIEEDGNNVTGLKIGKTAGGTEISGTSRNLSANGHWSFTPLQDYFSKSSAQSISIHATNFNGSTLQVRFLMRRTA